METISESTETIRWGKQSINPNLDQLAIRDSEAELNWPIENWLVFFSFLQISHLYTIEFQLPHSYVNQGFS